MARSTAIRRDDLATHIAEYSYEDEIFAAEELAPIFPVDKDNGELTRVTQKQASRRAGKLQTAPGNPAKRLTLSHGDDKYECKMRKFEVVDPDQSEQTPEGEVRSEREAAQQAYRMLRLEYEEIVKDYVQNDANFSVGNGLAAAAGTAWDDPAGKPINDVMEWKQASRRNTKVEPNAIVMPYDMVDVLTANPQVRDRLSVTRDISGRLDVADLAFLFNIEKIILTNAAYDNAPDGAEVDLEYIWEQDEIFLCRVMTSDSLSRPQTFRTIVNTLKTPDLVYADEYREEGVESSIYRVKRWDQFKPLVPETGFRGTGLLTG